MTTERIGFIGVGLMGAGMARNILKAGYPLTVVAHRNRAPVEELLAAGAREAAGLADLAGSCDIIHICAPGSPQVEAIVTAMLPHLGKDAVLIDCSTSDPTSTQKLAGLLAEKGVHLADAPLGGTPVQAEAGTLGTMVGADQAVYARIKPVIDAWAATQVHLGLTGMGHKMKLLNNFLSLGYGALYAEALAVARKVGISVDQFDSVIRGSRMDCGFYQTFMGYAVEGNRSSHKFTLTNAYKDARYVSAMGDAAQAVNPIATAVKNSLGAAINLGGTGETDYLPHLVDFVARANGMEPGKDPLE